MDDNRLSTGIPDLDKLMEGGIPKGALVLVSGPAGVGKTTLAARYLYHGICEMDEPGIYVSFWEAKNSFINSMARIGMDFASLEKTRKFKLLDPTGLIEPGKETAVRPAIEPLLTTISQEITSLKAKRVVIDSLSVLSNLYFNRIDMRLVLHRLLRVVTRPNEITTLLISEKPHGVSQSYGVGIEDFAADGVVALEDAQEGKLLNRFLQVVKMRGTRADRTLIRYETTDRGLVLYPPYEIRPVTKISSERIESGIEGLDDALGGGLKRGTVTLVTGSSGTGKTTFALQFSLSAARDKERSLFVCTEEAEPELILQAESFGWKPRDLLENGTLRFVHFDAEGHFPEQFYQTVTKEIQGFRPTRFVIDSMTPKWKLWPEKDFHHLLKSLTCNIKVENVTAFFTAVADSNEPITVGEPSTLVDNVLSLRDVEIESSLRRSLVFLKTRGLAHNRDIREFEISSVGIKIGQRFSNYEGITAGVARRISASVDQAIRQIESTFPDLDRDDASKLEQ